MMDTQNRETLVTRFQNFRKEGLSRSAMADRLNAEGVETPAGKKWTNVLVGAFMTREKITSSEPKVPAAIINKERYSQPMKNTTPARKAKTSTRANRQAPATQGFRPEFNGGDDAELVSIVTNVLGGTLSRSEKIRVLSGLIPA